MLQEATDATEHSTVQLSDETSDVLPDELTTKNIGLSDETTTTTNRMNSSSKLLNDDKGNSLPETTEDLPPKETEHPDHNVMTGQYKSVTDISNLED